MDDLTAFNKPCGVICQFFEHEEHSCLKDYVDRPGSYPAERSDTDNEGLLLPTDNGVLQAQIVDLKFKREKTYWAQVEGSSDEEELDSLRNGMDLGGFVTRSAKARLLEAGEVGTLWPRNPSTRTRKTVPDFWLEIQIAEGKNRRVRRMMAKVGYPCLRLVCVAVGRLNIFDLGLGLGEWRFAPSRSWRICSDSFLMREAVWKRVRCFQTVSVLCGSMTGMVDLENRGRIVCLFLADFLIGIVSFVFDAGLPETLPQRDDVGSAVGGRGA